MTAGPATAPLSADQRPIWFFDQLSGGDATFNMALAFRLSGTLDVAALEAALHDVASRHDSLRTTFRLVGDEVVQQVHADLPPSISHVDLSAEPAAAREEAARSAVAAHTNRPFNLEAGPLLRAMVVRLGPEEHILAVAVHHVVADGWSLGVFSRELAAFYSARVRGEPPPLPPLPLQYPQYARRPQDATAARDAYRHWRERLAAAPVLDLATDRPRPAVRTANGDVRYRTLDHALLTRIDDLARRSRCTRFMVLAAAFQVLLGGYSGQTDVCVGTQLAGRAHEDLEPMIGMFTHTAVLRADLADDPGFREHLTRTRRDLLAAMAHPEVPYERLLGELNVTRDPARGAFFDVMFVLQEFGGGDLELPGLRVTPVDPRISVAKLDLIVEAWQVPDGLQLSFAYNTDLWHAATVDRMAGHFGNLLQAIAADPDARLSALSLLDSDEERRLDAWAEADAAARAAATAPELVAARARRDGDRVAVRHGDHELRYAELESRAGTLAARLRGHGVRAGDVVAVCLDRSVELVVALLGIWKAGAAYLPLEPGPATDRTAFMVEDSGARLLLTRRSEAAGVGESPIPVICLDGEADPAATPAAPGPLREPGPEASDLAYVIYTSGSTGRPKGVAVSHGALAARVAWMRRHYEITAADRVLQFAAPSFDTHAEELYPCLTAGATLVAPTVDSALLPEFLAAPDAADVTVLDLPTPYWQELVLTGQLPELPPALRLLVLGADQVDPGALTRWHERYGDRVRVLNTYGPTETTIVATCAELSPGDAGAARPPIGRPVAGARCHVVDRRLNRAPVGVPGELLIGGAGLAHGYHGDPRLTARRFVPDPYGPPGARLYRTGDRVRWRADGQLEFLGRYDDQVKLRGYRVEPGEVTAALLADPRVRQAAAVVREDTTGDRRLVGYLVTDPADRPLAEIRAGLERRLPSHLVPSALVRLDRLPLTPTGKLDRAALPRPERDDLADVAPTPPRTDAEKLVAEIWADVLGLPAVGVHDDFFALGGHSLLATTMIGRLSAAVGLSLPLRTVFTERTVAGLAAVVEELLVAEIAALSEAEADQLLRDGRR
ncbi:MAG: amino acid adenylation domain-containing protein [Micromonosporaceae bacterium]|nr:amino acid adenylation domain-containing protein [Micromonosporaceae bacterium]